ncbi:MAG TPA: efflux RND transporter permease subunit, partial [Leptospiraceae bacterium]|nr:efflux RND transporter permease subunit [Leptospiraceae bacterium]
ASFTGERKVLMKYVQDHLKDKFSTVPGVGQIMLGGHLEPALRVWVTPKALNSRELTVEDIIQTIQREHIEVPAGMLETDKKVMSIRAMGEAETIDIFGKLPIAYRGGTPIFDGGYRLSTTAELEDGLEDVYRLSRFNGKSAVGIGIMKQRGVNAVETAEAVKKRMEELRKTLPEGFELGINFDTTRFIKESMDELEFNLILSAVLTSIVTFLFLGSLKSTLNILLAIPTSILGTFIFLDWIGFTLNTFTLLALSLAVGIVVDDAIMVLENIYRFREQGETFYNAAKKGARQISFAAAAATFSIVAIFLPVAFMKGIIGKYFYQFGVTITAAVMLSLLESLTLTPMRLSRFSGSDIRIERLSGWIERGFLATERLYERVTAFCIKWKYSVIIISTVLAASSFLILKPLKKEFVPSQDQSQFIVRIQTVPGSSLAYTDGFAAETEKILLKNKDVDRVYSIIGAGRGQTGSNSAMFFVSLKQPEEREINPKTKKRYTQSEIAGEIRKSVSGISKELKVFIQDLSMRGLSGSGRDYPVEFVIQGSDWDTLAALSGKIMSEMENTKKYTDIDTNYKPGQPEIHIIPDRAKALAYGVSMQSISNTIGAMIGGIRAGQFSKDGRRYNIYVRVKDEFRKQESDIKNLFVRNSRGELVRLADLVKTVQKTSLQSITRTDRQRAITIRANLGPGVSQSDALSTAGEISKKNLPQGYTYEFTGSAKTMGESFDSLLYALLLGIIVAYMILASQFGSYIHPVTVLSALPFSFSGAVAALYITGYSLNVFSFIALILLMGLVKKNSILLVDFTNHLRLQGMSPEDALKKACPMRLRPILMTSISTVAAAVPPALSVGPGGETRIPMAIAIIGGILVSTVLTLVVVPAGYLILSRFERPDVR